MSENSDALVIVVSEETGQISVAENGNLTRNFTRDKLHHLLTERLIPKQTEGKRRLSSRLRTKGKEDANESDA